jgi:Holliday junction DNA helicase RuvA
LISFIKGVLFALEEDNAIIDVGGVGYHLLIPPRVFPQDKKPGDEVFFYTYLQIKEDSWQLFGFPQKEQLEVFRLLISVSGIGAKLGLAVLNHFSYQEVIALITAGDSRGLSSVPGIGKKIAQRLVLELKDKFKKMNQGQQSEGTSPGISDHSINQDVVLALTQLGYSAPEARSACIRAYNALGSGADTQELIKGALKLLGKF